MAGRLQQLVPKSRTGYWRIFVKTRIQSLSLLATLAFAMICWGSVLQAQNTPSTSPDRQAQQPSSSPDTTPPQSTPDTTQSPDTTAPPPSSRTPDSGAQQAPSGAADSGAAAGTQTFSGTVVKQGDKYMLKDDSGHTYDIDHQDEVKKFEGKRVRVQGTLDASSNKIMVK
jgi:cytoskeletal protein RodZ